MQIIVDEMVINYEIVGSGKTILLVHGWADSLLSFFDLQKDLSKEYEVISLDMPGFGHSSQPQNAWDLEDYANLINKFILKLNYKIYCYIGHSNGGAVLIYGLSRKILSSNKLVLLSSAGIRNQNKLKKQTLKIISKSGKALTVALPKTFKKNLRKSFYGQIGSDFLISPGMEDTFKIIINHDIQDDSKKINIPTLLIYGREDKSTPIEYGETISQNIKGSKFVVLENAEHFVHKDQPNQVVKLIKEFLK